MVSSLGGASSRIDYNPTGIADLGEAGIKARLQIAALKTEQDMMRVQGEALLSLMEPNKGVHLDARA